MRFKLVIRSIVAMVSTILLGACAEEMELEISRPEGARLIELSGKIDQEYVTRADDAGFAYGDRMGIFIVDYEGASAGKLDMDNNRASNVAFTYDGESGKWKASQAVYWKDEFTPIDVYGYYPFDNSMLSATEHSFTVEADQSQEGGDGSLSGYEKSDFLWAKQTKMSPTGEPIILNYSHRMAGVKVTLEPGNGFVGEEWGKTEKVVAVDNIKRTGVINLSTGSVTPAGSLDKSIITSPQGADIYRAVVVPQQSTAGASLISITIEGESYSYTPSEAVTFRQGKITVFTLKIDKREGGKYAVALVAQGIENWENDRSSHNYEAAAYTIIDCPKEGELGNRIAAMGKEASTIRNLKVTGRMNGADFTFIREHIPNLMALNIAEVVCVYENGYRNDYLEETLYEHVLPDEALRDMASLSHLILPKELVVLGPFSLENIGLAYYSTLIIPSTVKVLELCCMAGIEQGNLILPEGLVYIGGSAMFCNQCKWEYNLGNTVKFIGDSAFTCYYGSASHCIGNFKLPENLEYLGGNAFQGFGENLTGNVTIPTTLNEIPFGAFQGMHFAKGTDVVFHSNIVSIEGLAFAGITFNKTIIWAENLLAIGSSAFEGCVFNGGISQIPDGVNRIGSNAFGRCRRLPKKIQMPANLSKISAETFYGSDMTDIILQTDVELIENDAFAYSNVESVTIGKFVDYIGDKAFSSCQQLRSIVCLAPEPPEMGADVFEWCDYDHLILEVPEASVQKYKNAEGWNKIKYITAHHELALSISQINCLNKGVKREVLVRSEGAWSLAECPDWCRVSQTSSNIHTTEITVTITPSSSVREGDIIFRLDGTDYTAVCHVAQEASPTPEDEEIVLQEATAGHTPIPIFIVGDGFDAQAITDGTYMECIKQQMEHFFAIEPYKSYRDHFRVSTAIAVSPDRGISHVERLSETRFGSVLDPAGVRCDYTQLANYVKEVSTGINDANIGNALIMVVMNQETFSGNVRIEDSGTTYAMTTLSSSPYPYDTRGLVQHYAGGRGFGRLAEEYVEHFDFIQACICPGCNRIREYQEGRAKGWYGNVSLSGSMSAVPWSHLIFDSRYSDLVDVFEGAYHHLRGAYRSESQSCMSTYIQYFNTISRELVVRRIMQLSGQAFDFEKFAAKDNREGAVGNE